jgi:hypothetical protein
MRYSRGKVDFSPAITDWQTSALNNEHFYLQLYYHERQGQEGN